MTSIKLMGDEKGIHKGLGWLYEAKCLQRKHVQNGPLHDVNVRPTDHTVAPNAVGTTAPEMGALTILLPAVSPQEQK
ncbi:hypothetical protein EJ110_NYTH54690 [Nymphaea thermarum]|nr:hypothetical protein EJ110_NYTH54690 [Nymphaea thermarum]